MTTDNSLLTMSQRQAAARQLNDALFIAFARSSVRMLDQALAKGADINAKDNAGLTVLMHAVWESNAPFVEALLQRKADHTLLSNRGMTILQMAQDVCVRVDTYPMDLGHKKDPSLVVLGLIKSTLESRVLLSEIASHPFTHQPSTSTTPPAKVRI